MVLLLFCNCYWYCCKHRNATFNYTKIVSFKMIVYLYVCHATITPANFLPPPTISAIDCHLPLFSEKKISFFFFLVFSVKNLNRNQYAFVVVVAGVGIVKKKKSLKCK